MKELLQKIIAKAAQDRYGIEVMPKISLPEAEFGDFATNVAFQLAGELKKAPKAIAQELAGDIKDKQIAEVSAAGNGYINIRLTDEALWALFESRVKQNLKGQVVVAEYSDPNPFKVLHAGHIYTTVVGDAISNLLEEAGAIVHRVNYGGDVGLHVGRTMWAIIKRLGGERPEKLNDIPFPERPKWLSACYVEGNNAYEANESVRVEVNEYNKQVYEVHKNNDHSSAFATIYWTCREWSYSAFDQFYDRLGTTMEKYYPESEVVELGLETVKKHICSVFEESDGAIVFRGEQYNLHTRVFVTSKGIPTYETKEVGLLLKKKEDYGFDRSVVITGNEQQEYMAVVTKAMEQFMPELVRNTQYIPHGMVRLAGGMKMSSRKGNIVPATEVLDATASANNDLHGKSSNAVVLAAVKYAFLKQRIGGDIIYDPDESVAIEGNSGPYIQYAHARARGILAKKSQEVGAKIENLQHGERLLLRKLAEYPDVVEFAINDLMPHQICTYLYELAQTFNRFYEANRVIGDEREGQRIKLVEAYAETLKKGLKLLGIGAPERV
jgi:arginyl-tRNA synthetase